MCVTEIIPRLVTRLCRKPPWEQKQEAGTPGLPERASRRNEAEGVITAGIKITEQQASGPMWCVF